jgi:hypothetical protein
MVAELDVGAAVTLEITGGVVSGTGVTVNVVLPTTPLKVALMAVVPGATPVAKPPVDTMATEVTELAQATTPVRSAVVASE